MSFFKRLNTRNVGNRDRVLRALPAVAFVALYATGNIDGTAAIVFGILSAMLLFTAVTGLCSIYAMFGISTCKARSS